MSSYFVAKVRGLRPWVIRSSHSASFPRRLDSVLFSQVKHRRSRRPHRDRQFFIRTSCFRKYLRVGSARAELGGHNVQNIRRDGVNI